MCELCRRKEKLAGLMAIVNGTPESRARTRSASLVPKIVWRRREETKVERIEREV